MSELGGSIRELAGKVFGRRGNEVKPIKETEKTPELKAQETFYAVILKSFTEQGLESIANYEPPNATFDLSKLRDQSVFRLDATTEYAFEDNPSEMLQSDPSDRNYGCVVKDNKGRDRLFRIKTSFLSFSNDRQLIVDISPDRYPDKFKPSDIKVEEVQVNSPLLSWDDPLNTFPKEFFDTYSGVVFVGVTVHKVELVAAGRHISQTTPQLEKSRNISVSTNLNPETSTR